jgi:YD repeat-containing protein
MVGIVTGQGAGLERSSAGVLGTRGQLGAATMGRGGDRVYVNAATGGLVVSRADEFLVGRGPDAFYGQTYNSSSDPAYAWAQSVNRVISNLTGTANTAGSTVTRGDGDGHGAVYTYDSAKGAYVTTEGGGAHDELRYANGAWTWTDGDSRTSETYTMIAGISGYHFVSSRVDADGNAHSYSWTAGGALQRITNANGDYAEFTLANGLPTQITTYAAGGTALLTRVRYAWDSLRRLTSVSVDLSPNDHMVADGRTYTTNYTYDGTSARITTIAQTDGSRLDIAYTQSGSDFRVTKLTQTVSGQASRVTGLYYDLGGRTTTIVDPLGGATTMRYDAAGNLVQVTHPVPAPGASAPTTSFAYNSAGDVVSVTESGRTTHYGYDSSGNMVSSRDASGSSVSRTYGSRNELLTSTEYAAADPDGAGPASAGAPLTTRYAYDAENHLRFTVSGDGRVTEYRYDAPGNLISTLRYTADLYNVAGLAATSSIAEGALAAWAAAVADKTTIQRSDATYDFRGNLGTATSYSKTLADGSGDLGSTYSRAVYVYDHAGNLLSRQAPGISGTETFVYDGLNRIVSSADAAGAVATITFNDAATTTTMALSGGTTRVSVFNKAGELISVTESGADIAPGTTVSAYDSLGRLRMQTDPTGRSTYFLYDSASRKVADITADGAMTEYGYDGANRLVKSVSYMNRLSTSQIALLSGFSDSGAGGATAGGVSGPAGSTLLQNGGFEQSGTYTATPTGRSNSDLPGWTKANVETFEQVSTGQMGVAASEGSFWLDLESIAKTGVIAVGSNLLFNGGFEQSGAFTSTSTGRSNTTLPGWSKTNTETFEQVSTGQMGVAASEGAFWLDMESVAKTGFAATGSNLLINGSFDLSGTFTATATGRSNTDIPGWTKANAETFEQVLSGQMGVTATNGSYWLDMESVAKTGVVAVGSNLVTNGGFEMSGAWSATATGRSNTTLPGWTKSNAETFEQVQTMELGVRASEGLYWLDMESVAKTGMTPVGNNLLVNGSFGQAGTYVDTATGRSHTTIPGWTKANPETFETVLSGQMGVTTLDGGYWLDLESTATTGPSPVGANLVVNGSFEQSTTYTTTSTGRSATVIPGWSKANPENFDQVMAETTEIDATDGLYFLDLDSTMGGGGTTSGPNLLINGSFEQSATTWAPTMNGRLNSQAENIPGWVKANDQGFEQMNSGAMGVAASNGSFYLDMESISGAESNMDISQTVANLTAGQQLTLKFDYANIAGTVPDHEGSPENSGAIEVYWNGLKIAVVAAADAAMTTKTFNVSAIEGSNTLRFREIGIADGRGSYLDNVQLYANVPAANGGNMNIYQTIPNLAAGEVMQLQFDYSSRAAPASGSFEVWWNNTLVATIADGGGQMKAKTYFLTAVAGSNTLRFKGVGTVDALGGVIDNVRMFKTQSPPHGGNMDISQTVANLAAGQTVQLQFDHANRTTAASGSFEVYWNNALVATINETGAAMKTKTYQLTAVAGNNTVRFKSLGTVDAAGASLDNVRLFAMAPVPSGGNMDISQTIGGLTAGQTMQLQFDHANRTSAASGSFEVYWNNVLVATISETGTTMQTKTYLVTAIAGNNSLRFRSLGTVDDAGASIDNVRLFATQPVPSGGNMDISQTVGNLAAGQVMQLQFDHANRTTSASGSFEVYWNNALVATVTDTGTAMQTKSYFVSAIAGNNTLRFRSVGTVDDAGASIDNVRLFATTPVPSGGNMDINQTVSGLAAGQTMQLQFDHANRTSAASGSFEVYWNNVLVATVADGGTAMQTKTYLVTAVAGNNTLRFRGIGTVDDAGASIDNVRLFATQTVSGGGNMDISQTVGGLVAGQVMQLQFDHANRTTAASGSFEIWWNNALVATISETGTAMRSKSYLLTAIAGNNTLRFKSLGTVDEAGASIDNVRLFAMQSGGPAAPAAVDPLAGLRPGAAANDDWNWHIYDAADRLIETIDGAGRATLFSYDAASRLVSSKAYATPFDAGMISFFKSSTPVWPYLPGSNSATDRSTRNFYDSDGRLVGTLDGAGGLTQIFHDGAGQKIREIAYANPAASNLRNLGTFAELLANVGTSASDRRTDYVYDRRGLVRYMIDGLGHPTELVYDSAGQVIRAVEYAGAIAASDGYSAAYVEGQIGALGLASNTATRVTRSVYDGVGRLAFTIDSEGGTVAFAYDLLGRPIKETRYAAVFAAAGDHSAAAMQGWAAAHAGDPGNRMTRQIYDAAGQVAYSVDGEGFVTEQRYDTAGRILQTIAHPTAYPVQDGVTKTDLAAQIGATTAAAVVTTYAYDAVGQLTDVTDGAGIVTHYVHDALGQVVEETVAFGTADSATLRRVYDSVGRTVSETMAYGTAEASTSSYVYDALGNVLTIVDPKGFATSRSYDALGRTLSVTAPIDDSTSATSSMAYNRFGDVVRSTDARGFSSYSYFDRLGRLVATRDAEDYVTETVYNAFSEVASVTRRYNRANNGASATALPTFAANAKDATTRFDYDRRGQVVKATDAEGHYEEFTVDALGATVAVRNKLGGVTTRSFDRRGLMLSETLPSSSTLADGGLQSATVTNRFEYDSRGNRTRMIEASGLLEERITNYVYDKLDRLVEGRGESVTVLSDTDHYSETTAVPVERLVYDLRGNLIEEVDALGARSLYYYDRLDRRVAAIDPLGTLSTFSHDANGNVILSRTYGTPVAMPGAAGGSPPAPPAGEFRQIQYSYDKLNRMRTTSVEGVRTGSWNGSAYVTNVTTRTTSYEYDANGNVIRSTDPNGGIAYAYHDRLGRTLTSVDEEGFLTDFTYDSEGNVLTERRYAQRATGIGSAYPTASPLPDDRATSFTYDRNGRRLTEQRHAVSAYNVTSTGALPYAPGSSTVTYAYNGLGQVTRKTEATGDFIDYSYDSSGRLTTESRASYIDHDNNWVRPTVDYSYDGMGRLTYTRQGNPVAATGDRITRNSYDRAGRLTSMVDATGASYSYAYDIAGNLLRESYTRRDSAGNALDEALLYSRDLLGRTIAQSVASKNGAGWIKGDIQGIAYNAFGDVARRGLNGVWQERFDYDSAGQLWRTTANDGVWRYFVQDGNGNQTLAIESEGSDLSDKTIDQVLALATGGGAHSAGAAYVDGINVTISAYDRRGQSISTRLAQRQLNETGAPIDLVATRSYNAFGEIAWETDAKGARTDYGYNTMGRMVSIRMPTVSATSETGAVQDVNPTEYFQYDISGRLIGHMDANGRGTNRMILAGTGYGGSEAALVAEFHPDGGAIRNAYDVFGDARKSWDEVGRQTSMSYDARGRVIEVARASGLTEHFTYDLLGQRLRHWNTLLGAGNVQTTDYDRQGRVVSEVAFGGDSTTTTYSWDSNLVTGAMGAFGGWVQMTTYANGRTMVEKADMFGRDLYKKDLGDHVFEFDYDRAGRAIRRTGGTTVTYSHLNSGLLGSVSTMRGSLDDAYEISRTIFGYDLAGNKTSERFVKEGKRWEDFGNFYVGGEGGGGGGPPVLWNPEEDGFGPMPPADDGDGSAVLIEDWPPPPPPPPDPVLVDYSDVYQDAIAAYDALGRMVSWSETGNGTTPAASIQYDYDANGNVRRTRAQFLSVTAHGGVGAPGSKDHWYRYDAMNRVVTSKGVLEQGQIHRGDEGVDILYDAAGQRVTTVRTSWETASVWDPNAFAGYDDYGNPQYGANVDVSYLGERREDYGYDGGGYLDTVRIARSGYNDNGDGTVTATPPPAVGDLKADYTHDSMGRLTRQVDYGGNGSNSVYDRTVVYNEKGQIRWDTVISLQGWTTIRAITGNEYVARGTDPVSSYALGAVVYTATETFKNGSSTTDNWTETKNSYVWWDGAMQDHVTHTPNVWARDLHLAGAYDFHTQYSYNDWGQLHSVQVNDGRPRTVTFTNNVAGQAIRRDESNSSSGAPHEVWYRFDGRQLGATGNNGTLETDYQSSIDNRTLTPGPGAFRFGRTSGSAYADFDQNFSPINSYNQGGAAGSYTVRTGDTLSSIASSLWGDSALWFKLAEANGMSAATGLVEGQRLTIPAGVIKSHHNSSTFKPYNPGDILGDVSPTTPRPQTQTAQKKNKCGIFGQILLVVVAVAVTFLTHGALAAPMGKLLGSTLAGTIAAGAMAGVAGSVASQTLGVITGIQEKFDWKGVAMAGIAGAVSGALQGVPFLKAGGGKFTDLAKDITRAAAASAITQGIGVATRLQGEFSWAAVAAAGVGAGVDSLIGVSPISKTNNSPRAYIDNALAGSASAIASAAAKSLIDGSDFGDNVLTGLAGVIGNTIGNMIAFDIKAPPRRKDGVDSPIPGGVGDGQMRMMNASQTDGAPEGIKPCIIGTVPDCRAFSDFGNEEATPIQKKAWAWALKELAEAKLPVEPAWAGYVLCQRYYGYGCVPPPVATATAEPEEIVTEVRLPFSNTIIQLPLQELPEGYVLPDPSSHDELGKAGYEYIYKPLFGPKAPRTGPIVAESVAYNGFSKIISGFIRQDWDNNTDAYTTAGKLLGSIILPGWSNFTAVTRTIYDVATGQFDYTQSYGQGGVMMGMGNTLSPVVRFGKRLDDLAKGFRDLAAQAEFKKAMRARLKYMGGTPSKYSRVGKAVVARMRANGDIVGEGAYLKGNPNNLMLKNADGTFTRIDETVDMAHIEDAVTWWNEKGRMFGARSPEVKAFMNNPDNYVLQPRSINRSEGARLRQEYKRPAAPRMWQW